MTLSSNRPYLIRALYDWLQDNDLTPHLLVDASQDDVVVPMEFVEQGRIVLNIGQTAVRDLVLGNDLITFSARFSGKSMSVMLPPAAVLGIYARENGRGMLFPDDEEKHGEWNQNDEDPDPTPPRDRPSLKIVK